MQGRGPAAVERPVRYPNPDKQHTCNKSGFSLKAIYKITEPPHLPHFFQINLGYLSLIFPLTILFNDNDYPLINDHGFN